ncbi:MAG TPA: MFS transporter [Dehalococcoidia bacterium]
MQHQLDKVRERASGCGIVPQSNLHLANDALHQRLRAISNARAFSDWKAPGQPWHGGTEPGEALMASADGTHRASGLGMLGHGWDFGARWWPVMLLGLLTVGAYGFSFYSFGVFLEPISADTGWSTTGLSGAFALGSVVGGAGGVIAGRIFDARGPRPVFIVGLAVGSTLMILAANASSLLAFALRWGAGAGAVSASLFYNITMATTSRLYPHDRAKAFTVLTFVGGFALPIFSPLAGFAIGEWGWRDAMRVLVGIQAVLAVPAIILVSANRPASSPEQAPDEEEGYASLRDALRSREVIQMSAMLAFSIAAVSAIQVHHVAAFRGAGLSLGAAATLAGIRGLISLPGRGALAIIQGRLGTAGATLTIYVLMAAGALLLVPAGHIAFVWVFVIITGFAFGTVVPLQGLYSAEVLGNRRLGTLLGVQAVVLTLAGASGPLLIGFIADASDSYRPALVLMAALHAVAILLLLTRPRRRVSQV